MKRKTKHKLFDRNLGLAIVVFAQIILLGSITNSYFFALIIDKVFFQGQHIPVILMLGIVSLLIFYISIILLRINHNLIKLKNE